MSSNCVAAKRIAGLWGGVQMAGYQPRQIAISNANNPFTGPSPETLSSAIPPPILSVLMTCFISPLYIGSDLLSAKFSPIEIALNRPSDVIWGPGTPVRKLPAESNVLRRKVFLSLETDVSYSARIGLL